MPKPSELQDPNPVVSVRLDRALLDKLDGLVARTGRSRGFYLRTAIEAQLPSLVEQYWGHEIRAAVKREDDEFRRLMLDAMSGPEDTDK